MKKQFKICVLCFIVFCIGMVVGHDWPYFVPPKEFGIYTHDKQYKFVITEDQTRLCKLVTIFDMDNNVVFHTSGYMDKGWHEGVYDLEIAWGIECYDLFVKDDQGTKDIYLFYNGTWLGPMALKSIDGGTSYILSSPPYDCKNEFASILSSKVYSSDNIPASFK